MLLHVGDASLSQLSESAASVVTAITGPALASLDGEWRCEALILKPCKIDSAQHRRHLCSMSRRSAMWPPVNALHGLAGRQSTFLFFEAVGWKNPRVCFIQWSSSLSGKSSRAWAPRVSYRTGNVLPTTEYHFSHSIDCVLSVLQLGLSVLRLSVSRVSLVEACLVTEPVRHYRAAQ